MLTSLCIQNFAIVKHLELDFSQGMTAFTGETGAGKSIMIDALMLALGGRADASVVRSGADKCDITAIFRYNPNSEPALWLEAHDLASEGDEIILRRVFFAEGRSKSTINGQAFPLQKVKELSETLVHIHGQHQHQTLMQHTTHRQQLDLYADHPHLLQEVQQNYKKYQKVKQALEALQNQDSQKDRRGLLQFQCDELAALALEEGEMQALHEEHQHLHRSHDYLAQAQKTIDLLASDDHNAIISALHQVLQALNTLPQTQKNCKNAQDLLNTALIHAEEALAEIQDFSENLQLNPERLEEVESRMSLLHQTGRKYHVDASQLPVLSAALVEELARIEASENQAQILETELLELRKTYDLSANHLRKSRQEQALKLAQAISESIQQLGMPKGYVDIEFTPLEKMQAHGLDKIEYKVCTNPGMLPDALHKIASGGELSRISLAIQMITAQRGATPTLLFDEVDVGIGGATAALVGRLLRTLGERLQVFCVTHQPQVAASAHHHFVVAKHSDNEQTYTDVQFLPDLNQRKEEIARMLGGLTITGQTLSHAKELLEQQYSL